MVKFIIIVVSIIAIWNISTKKYNDDDNICELYMGKPGCGKTTNMAMLATKYIKKGYSVYSDIDIPGCYKFDFKDLGQYAPPVNSVILLDEVGISMNNRKWKSFTDDLQYLFKLRRHYGYKIFMFTQGNDVDLKVKQNLSACYIVNKYLRVLSVSRKVMPKLTIENNNSSESGKSNNGGDIVYKYHYVGLFSRIVFIPKYVNLFDSYERKELGLIDSKYIDYVESNFYITKKFGYAKYLFKCFRNWTKKEMLNIFNKIRNKCSELDDDIRLANGENEIDILLSKPNELYEDEFLEEIENN